MLFSYSFAPGPEQVNIGGLVVDKLYFKDHEGAEFCSVERRIIAATTCYDIYRDGECIAKVDRELFSATPQYKYASARTLRASL